MQKRTFQEIYDFCTSDDTYRLYHDVPDGITDPDDPLNDYLYRNLGRGLSRAGTYLFNQAYKQLERYLFGAPSHYALQVNYSTSKTNHIIQVSSYIEKTGVIICFTHPLSGKAQKLNPRSHNWYNESGISNEVISFLSDEKKPISLKLKSALAYRNL